MKRLGSALLDLVYPRQCVVTGQNVDNPPYRYLSQEALLSLEPITAPYCPSCGGPIDGEVAENRICPNCIELKPVFTSGRSLYVLNDSAKHIIHRLKYHRGIHLIKDIAQLIAQHEDFLNNLDGAVLVPVPLHPKRQRWRTFNQSERIAKACAKLNCNCSVQPLLKRIQNTEIQARLNKEERRKNVRKAFAVNKRYKVDSNARYILVDDVFTTGATLNACAKTLKLAGAQNIEVATLAHG